MDPHCFDADPDPDQDLAQNLDADPDPDPGGGGGVGQPKMCIPHGKNIGKPLSTKLFKVVDDLLHVYFQCRQKELCLQAVLWIRIHLINVFL